MEIASNMCPVLGHIPHQPPYHLCPRFHPPHLITPSVVCVQLSSLIPPFHLGMTIWISQRPILQPKSHANKFAIVLFFLFLLSFHCHCLSNI